MPQRTPDDEIEKSVNSLNSKQEKKSSLWSINELKTM